METPLLVGSVGTGLATGGVFGARHAFEADHVAAVATLVEDDARPAVTGLAWGVGHSLPVLLLGALSLGVGVRVPNGLATAFELLVVALLVALGVRVLAGRDALGIAILRHVHGARDDANGGHRHLEIGDRRVGVGHSHGDETPLAVGVVHGLAGSGGIVVVLAATAQTVLAGATFLLGFVAASIVGMGAASWLWGRAVGQARGLRVLAGLASIVVGVALFVEVLGYAPVL